MLTLTILGDEFYDEEKEEFLTIGDVTLQLEHSLLSLSKWESIVMKPFLSADDKTPAEIRQYIEAMILTQEFPPNVVDRFSTENFDAINAYIESAQSATTFGELPKVRQGRGEIVTSELIYYWMSMFGIPFYPTETWHLNRLFALIRIANLKNSKPTPMSKSEIAARNKKINDERRAKLGTKG